MSDVQFSYVCGIHHFDHFGHMFHLLPEHFLVDHRCRFRCLVDHIDRLVDHHHDLGNHDHLHPLEVCLGFHIDRHALGTLDHCRRSILLNLDSRDRRPHHILDLE